MTGVDHEARSVYRDVSRSSAIPELRLYEICRYILIGQLYYGKRWRRGECHSGSAMSKCLCSMGWMPSNRTMTVTAMYLQSVQHFECLQKAASKLSGMNMHSGLEIDAIGMAFVAGLWTL